MTDEELNGIPIVIGFIFLGITTVTFLVLKNIVLATVIENLSKTDSSESAIFQKRISKFPNQVWKKIDPEGNGYASFKDIIYYSKIILPYFGISREFAKSYSMRE